MIRKLGHIYLILITLRAVPTSTSAGDVITARSAFSLIALVYFRKCDVFLHLHTISSCFLWKPHLLIDSNAPKYQILLIKLAAMSHAARFYIHTALWKMARYRECSEFLSQTLWCRGRSTRLACKKSRNRSLSHKNFFNNITFRALGLRLWMTGL